MKNPRKRIKILNVFSIFLSSCISEHLATRPKLQGQRRAARSEEDFSLSSDGKLMINDEENTMQTNETDESKPLDIGEQDMLGGK